MGQPGPGRQGRSRIAAVPQYCERGQPFTGKDYHVQFQLLREVFTVRQVLLTISQRKTHNCEKNSCGRKEKICSWYKQSLI